MGRLPLLFKRRVLGVFAMPSYADSESNFRTNLILKIVLGLTGLSIYLGGKLYFSSGESGLAVGVIGVGILGSIISKTFLNKSDVIKAVSASIGFLWVVLSIGVWFSPWGFSPMVIGQLCVVSLSGVLSEKKHTLGLAILTLGLNYYVSLDQTGQDIEHLIEFNQNEEWSFILLFLFIAVTLSRYTKNFGRKQDGLDSENARRYQALFERATDAVFLFSKTGVVLYVNQHALDLLNYPMEELVGMHVDQLIAAEENLDMSAVKQQLLDGTMVPLIETSIVKSNGGRIPVEIGVVLVYGEDHEPSHVQAVVRDVSRRREMEQDLRHMAHHDQLTKLPNRLAIQKALERASSRAVSEGHGFAILFADLDDFKNVNDTYGHAAGDHVLRKASEILQSSLRGSDMVARWGGDEFIILLNDIANPAQAGTVAEKLLENFANNSMNGVIGMKSDERVYCSIGISLFPQDDDDWGELIEKADQAMYTSKTKGKRSLTFYKDK